MILTFSFLATIAALNEGYKKWRLVYFSLSILQIFSLIVSMSRTGMLGFACVFLVYYFRYSGRKLIKYLLVGFVIVLLMNYISIWMGIQFSLQDRFSSIFNAEYSSSNVERYGIAQSLMSMALSPGAILGYGFFNYMYYLPKFFSPLMASISYSKIEDIPSFNLIVQLIAEVGWISSVLGVCAMVIFWIRIRKITAKRGNAAESFKFATICGVLLYAMSVNVFAFEISFLPILASSLILKEPI
jgi:hypothetical protein